ncbi:LAETG motif-containing sortase-dependent surface protein [Streptomyces sp. NPDC006309]|uniref:LAETG motif-containing sortase-dependent surface protein n=1 Tax=Streptomyces sp. NPDC006309 TaxID=3156749 RepID=UPI00339E4FD3
MSSVRRPLLTATAAGTLLCALWFVPSANASQTAAEGKAAGTSAPARAPQARAVTAATTEATRSTGSTGSTGTAVTARAAEAGTELADTGGPDTTPYVVGGSLFLSVGAGFVVYSVRRERLEF